MTGCAGCDITDLQRDLRAEFPKYSLQWKKHSPLMRAIDVFLKIITFGFMSTFMVDFITTIGFTVYVPDCWASMTDGNRLIVLRHERVHMRQRVKYGSFLFSFLYLFCPLPAGLAYFRMKFEREAYEETLQATYDVYQSYANTPKFKEEIIRNFTGPAYFWMWPFPKSMRSWFDRASAAVLVGDPSASPSANLKA